MGSFIGHAIPGLFFVLFSLWWSVQMLRRYYESLRGGGAPYVSTPTWKVRLGRFGVTDVEAKVGVVCCALGMLVELVASPMLHGTGVGSNNAQHATMYFFFGLMGLTSLVLPRMRIFPNHEEIVYCILVLAYSVEALLFKFHLYGRDDVDVLLHTLLLYAIYACALSTLAEMRWRRHVLVALARAFFTGLQGTWFWHAAFVLYPPFSDPWGHSNTMCMGCQADGDEDGAAHGAAHGAGHGAGHGDHHALMMIVMAYAWHMAALLVLLLLVAALIGCRYRGELEPGKLAQHAHPHHNGYTVISLQGDNTTQGDEELE